jgi:hypothetical protein
MKTRSKPFQLIKKLFKPSYISGIFSSVSVTEAEKNYFADPGAVPFSVFGEAAYLPLDIFVDRSPSELPSNLPSECATESVTKTLFFTALHQVKSPDSSN